MSVLSTDVATPEPGTRRARRLAAAAASSPSPEVLPATSQSAPEAAIVDSVAPERTLTRRELRLAREAQSARHAVGAARTESALAAPIAPLPAAPVAAHSVHAAATAAEVLAAAAASGEAVAPVRDVPAVARKVAVDAEYDDAEDADAPELPVALGAPAADDAVPGVAGVPLTRRALREAARRATSATAASAGESAVATAGELAAPVENGFCADAALEQADVEHPVAERRELAQERELAAVALTISRLAVAAVSYSTDVAAVAEATEPESTASAEDAEAGQAAAASAAAIVADGEGAAEGVVDVVADDADGGVVLALRRRDRRAAPAMPAVPAVPQGMGVREALPTVLPLVQRVTAAPTRHWVPRLAVLTALGAATVVTPVVAAASTGATLEPALEPVPLAAESALQTLTTISAVPADGTVLAAQDAAAEPEVAAGAEAAAEGEGIDAAAGTASLLASDQLAATRDSVSRSVTRSELPQCGTPDDAVPNGALAALDSTEYVSLSMPVQEGVYRLTSQFGPRWGSTHAGTDFAAAAGTPIHAIADGKVIYSGGGKAGRSGMLVIIEHTIEGKKVESWYVHMYPDGVFVEAGDTVTVGDVIGEVGSYGNSTGPHLHLEIHTGDLEDTMGSAVDPLAWLNARSATPITSSQVCS